MPTLKALIGGQWVAVSSGGGGSGSDEVFIQADDPIAANPLAELWYDTDAPSLSTQLPVEILYAELLADVSVTSTSVAAPTMVINPGSVVYDGSPIIIEFYTSALCPPTVANSQIILNLYDGNTDIGYIAQCFNPAANNMQLPALVRRRLTPTPGAHSYNVRSWVSQNTGAIRGGPGNTAANFNPGYLRVTKAIPAGAAIAPPQGGLEGNRPAAGAAYTGLRYFATDTKRDWLCDGTGWIIMSEPDQTYTPALTGVTIGTGTQSNTGTFSRSNGRISLLTKLVLGTGGLFTATPTVGLPPGVLAGGIVNGQVGAWMYDLAPSAIQFQGIGEIAIGGNVIYPRASGVSGTSIMSAYAHASGPMVWAVGDTLSFFGTFPMNSRYS